MTLVVLHRLNSSDNQNDDIRLPLTDHLRRRPLSAMDRHRRPLSAMNRLSPGSGLESIPEGQPTSENVAAPTASVASVLSAHAPSAPAPGRSYHFSSFLKIEESPETER